MQLIINWITILLQSLYKFFYVFFYILMFGYPMIPALSEKQQFSLVPFSKLSRLWLQGELHLHSVLAIAHNIAHYLCPHLLCGRPKNLTVKSLTHPDLGPRHCVVGFTFPYVRNCKVNFSWFSVTFKEIKRRGNFLIRFWTCGAQYCKAFHVSTSLYSTYVCVFYTYNKYKINYVEGCSSKTT